MKDSAGDRDTTTQPIMDAHVHIFPDNVFQAIRRWFDKHAWKCIYEANSEAVDRAMCERGIERYLGLHYSHTPGLAEILNQYCLDFAATHPRCIPVATVLPGEPNDTKILESALKKGVRFVKLHCHVQRFAMNSAALKRLIPVILDFDATVTIHCGNEPKSDAYLCDIDEICHVSMFRETMDEFPELRVIVPHLGAAESKEYADCFADYPNFYMDTSMAISDYLGFKYPPEILADHADRILFGTDFPNIPYPWQTERDLILARDISEEAKKQILYSNFQGILQQYFET